MASNAQSKNYNSSKDPFVMIFIWLLILVIIGFFYWGAREVFHPLYYRIKYIQLYPFYFFMPELKEYLSGDIKDSGLYTFGQMLEGAAFYGKYAFWTLIVPAAYMLLKVKDKYIFKNKKLQDAKNGSEELLRLNSRVHAIVRPVAHRNIREMSPNVGPWRYAETPLFFAVKNNLIYDPKGNPFRLSELYNNVPDDMNDPKFAYAPLVDPRLNCIYIGQKNLFHFQKAYNVFLKQLGSKILFNNIFDHFKKDAEINNVPPWKLVLAGIYYRFGTSQRDKESLAYPYMDKMATLCGGKDELNIKKLNSLTMNDASTLWKGWRDNERFANFITNGISFERSFFMHMVAWAKEGGKITPSEFVWLRAIDRPLYYAINQVGGRTAYSESLGVWMHYAAERFTGETLHYPYELTAGQSLYMSLYREGYLPYHEFDEENLQMPTEIVKIMESVNLTGTEQFSGGVVTKDSLKTKLYDPETQEEKKKEEESVLPKFVSVAEKILTLKSQLTMSEELCSYFQSPPRFIINYPIEQNLEEGKWENKEAALKKYRKCESLEISYCEWCKKPVKNENSGSESGIYIVPLWDIDDERGTLSLKSLNFLCLHCWVRQYYLHQELIAQRVGKKESLNQAYAVIISSVEPLFGISPEEFEKNYDIMRQIRDLREKKTWALAGGLDKMILEQPEKIVVDGIVQKIKK